MCTTTGRVESLTARNASTSFFDVVAFAYIDVVVAEGAEEVALGGAVGVAQKFEVLIDAAMVGRNAHLVIVDHHNEIAVEQGSVVQSLESLASAERAVAYYGHHIFMSSLHVAGFGQTGCQGKRCGGMADGEEVVGAFVRIGIACNIAVFGGIEKRCDASCEHFVHVGLVRHVEHDFIFRGVEHVVESYRGLHEAEIGTNMATHGCKFLQQRCAEFGCEVVELFEVESADVGGRFQFRQIEVPRTGGVYDAH